MEGRKILREYLLAQRRHKRRLPHAVQGEADSDDHGLLRLKYHDSITDAVADLGGKPEEIGTVFAGFQQYLYAERVA